MNAAVNLLDSALASHMENREKQKNNEESAELVTDWLTDYIKFDSERNHIDVKFVFDDK